DDDSGNLLSAPVDVTGPAGFADSAFVWVARPEDVGFVTATHFAFGNGNGGIGGGSFPDQIQVFACSPPEQVARKVAFAQRQFLARCTPVPSTIVGDTSTLMCNTTTGAFTAQVH